jgi:putative PIN family toxin of toxin-antitoxin system
VRVLLDTNVVLSAILTDGRARTLLRSVIRGERTVVTSPFLLNELEGLLVRKFGFTAEAARATRMEFEALAEVVDPKDVPRVSRDEDDDHVLPAALTGAVDALVTGDGDLLTLGTYEGIPIVPPAEALSRQV